MSRIALACLLALSVWSCRAPDDEQATTFFTECLRRNGVDARDVHVTLARDGSIEGISAEVIGESGAPYEPAVRLACTEEVENR